MNILITGATGFLGSALARHWMRAGHKLTLIVRPNSSMKRLTSLLGDVQLATINGSKDIVEILQREPLDAIVHTACAYGRQNEIILQLFDANVRLGLTLIEAILNKKSERITFINTGTILPPMVSNYALGKYQFTQWGQLLSTQYSGRLKFINIRLQHMYGPGDDASKFATQVLHACYRNQLQLALTAGEQRRDLIYIEDVVSAYDVLLTNRDKFSDFEDVDVGSGTAPTIRHFVETVHGLTKSNTQLQFGAVPYRPNEPMYCQADIKKLNALDWKPDFSLEQGILKTIEMEFQS